MSNGNFIQINPRAYKYIRQYAIQSVDAGIVELITNALDAYGSAGTTYPNGDPVTKLVEIEYNFESSVIKVRDYAIGLTAEKMQSSFLQLGDYTNYAGARGFFSRGAKDISALGDVTFCSIKDELYSQCVLDSDAYGLMQISDVPVDDSHRKLTGIPSPRSGLMVKLELSNTFSGFDIPSMNATLKRIACLRKIFMDPNNIIIARTKSSDWKTTLNETRLTYAFFPGSLMLELDYNVPGYQDIPTSAHLTLYQANIPITEPIRECELEFGLLIEDNTTVYECSVLEDKNRYNPYVSRIYGVLHCDRINKLLYDYDINGPSEKNPYPIIDPSRSTGVNKNHPFIQALYSVPKVRLDLILRQLNTSVSNKSISLDMASELLSEISNFGMNLLDTTTPQNRSYTLDYNGNLVRAIQDDRMNHVNYEKNYTLSDINATQLISSDAHVIQQIINTGIDTTQNSFILDINNNVFGLPKSAVEENTPANILEMVKNISPDEIQPYVYSLDSDGKLIKLYIFDKGNANTLAKPEEPYVEMMTKKFEILFFKDINIIARYIIDTDNGIVIKLNLNDPLIDKYLVQTSSLDASELTIKSITSTQSLIFLREMIIEIFADLIIQNDILNNILILDSNNYNNLNKLSAYRHSIINRIEIPIDDIFGSYVTANISQKHVMLLGAVNMVGSTITNDPAVSTRTMAALTAMRKAFETSIQKIVE